MLRPRGRPCACSGFTQRARVSPAAPWSRCSASSGICLLRDDQIVLLGTNFRLTATAFYSRSMVPAGTFLTRHLLDRLSADPADDEFGTGTTRPILVRDSDGHTFSTNTQAILERGPRREHPRLDGFIGRDPDGYPNRLLLPPARAGPRCCRSAGLDVSGAGGQRGRGDPERHHLVHMRPKREHQRPRPHGSASPTRAISRAHQPGDRCRRAPR